MHFNAEERKNREIGLDGCKYGYTWITDGNGGGM